MDGGDVHYLIRLTWPDLLVVWAGGARRANTEVSRAPPPRPPLTIAGLLGRWRAGGEIRGLAEKGCCQVSGAAVTILGVALGVSWAAALFVILFT